MLQRGLRARFRSHRHLWAEERCGRLGIRLLRGAGAEERALGSTSLGLGGRSAVDDWVGGLLKMHDADDGGGVPIASVPVGIECSATIDYQSAEHKY